MIRFIQILTILSSLSQFYCQSIETEIFVHSSSDTLWGSFVSPQEKLDSNQTLVLIISGSGPTNRNGNNSIMINNSYLMLANDLAKFGYPSIRYDKRGVESSINAYIDERELKFEQNVHDAKLFYNWARSNGYKKIVLLGHSEGSLISILLAKEVESAGLISLSGPGRPIQVVLKEQYQETSPIVRDSASKVIDLIASGKAVDTLAPWLYSIFRPNIQGYLKSWMAYDPAVEINNIDVPILIIQGDLDLQVSVNDAEILMNGNNNKQLAIIEGMNHVLKKVTDDRQSNKASYNDPNLPLHSDLIFSIVSFLKKIK